jgi:Family of unknown function (DUF6335)
MAKRNVRSRTKKTASRTAKPHRAAPSRRQAQARKTARKAARPKRTSKAVKPARRAAAPHRQPRGGPDQRRATNAPPAVRAARPKPAALQRERRTLPDEVTGSIPSTLDFSPKASAAESGRASFKQHRREHTEAGPELTGGDVDADWGEAYADGDEAPGGDNPTPDQDVVEEIGRALGVEYDDAEELKGADKILERDRHRWEYDPASADDYRDRNKKE